MALRIPETNLFACKCRYFIEITYLEEHDIALLLSIASIFCVSFFRSVRSLSKAEPRFIPHPKMGRIRHCPTLGYYIMPLVNIKIKTYRKKILMFFVLFFLFLLFSSAFGSNTPSKSVGIPCFSAFFGNIGRYFPSFHSPARASALFTLFFVPDILSTACISFKNFYAYLVCLSPGIPFFPPTPLIGRTHGAPFCISCLFQYIPAARPYSRPIFSFRQPVFPLPFSPAFSAKKRTQKRPLFFLSILVFLLSQGSTSYATRISLPPQRHRYRSGCRVREEALNRGN